MNHYMPYAMPYMGYMGYGMPMSYRMPTRYYRDMVFEILTDEMKHADKYNYILNIN